MRILKHLFLAVVLMAVSYVAFAGVYEKTAYYPGASSTSDALIQAGIDITSAFALVTGINENYLKFPTKVNVFWSVTQSTGTDSTLIYLGLQVSNDNSTWLTYSALDTITAGDVSVVQNALYEISSPPNFRYWRFITTAATAAGDTNTVGPINLYYTW